MVGSRGKGIEMISYPWLECFLEGDGEGFERIRRGSYPQNLSFIIPPKSKFFIWNEREGSKGVIPLILNEFKLLNLPL